MSDKELKFEHKKYAQRDARSCLIATIDIGSNSVRMVVYQGLRRNPRIIFNERILCGLGEGVSATGMMNEVAVERAMKILERFALLCDDMEVDIVRAIATSAVRDSSNGAEFVTKVEQECGFKVEIIDGYEEARLTALGVISAFPVASGIVGDLGGGSLELALIKDDQIIETTTLPIGPLRVMNPKGKVGRKQLKVVAEALDSVPWLRQEQDMPFYLVGGAWRAISRLHMLKVKHSVPVIHAYRAPRDKLISYLDGLADKKPQKLPRVPEIVERRYAVIPAAAAILRQVLLRTTGQRVICCDNGVREGMLYDFLDERLKKQDPFIAACKDMADQTSRFPEHADKLMLWMAPLFKGETENERRLRFASCMLSDIGWQGHPDYRAEQTFDSVFTGRFTGIGHKGRAIVALALYISYGGPERSPRALQATKILTDPEVFLAKEIGYALRMGQRMTAGTAQPLEYTSFEIERDKVIFKLPRNYAALMGESVERRFQQLCELRGAVGEVILTD